MNSKNEKSIELLKKTTRNILAPDYPADPEQKIEAEKFIKEFMKAAQLDKVSVELSTSEILSLIILELTTQNSLLKVNLQKSKNLNKIAHKMRTALKNEDPELPFLIKLYDLTKEE